ncbi:hypothetical protein [Tolypothrix sp. VBCCA 56010]
MTEEAGEKQAILQGDVHQFACKISETGDYKRRFKSDRFYERMNIKGA